MAKVATHSFPGHPAEHFTRLREAAGRLKVRQAAAKE